MSFCIFNQQRHQADGIRTRPDPRCFNVGRKSSRIQMCIVYNPVGCLTAVKSHLTRHNITDFKSINELIAFQRDYAALRQHIISNSEAEIANEKSKIISDNLQLNSVIESTKESVRHELLDRLEYLKTQLQLVSTLNQKSIWRKASNYFKTRSLKKSIRSHEQSLESKILQSVQVSVDLYQKNDERLNYITSKFQEAVIDNCSNELNELERKKVLIDEVNSSIYGAIGEQKVAKELEKLPDDCVLINDFCLFLDPPIFNRNENDHIKSIQIDHLLITPSGVFLIETKNWGERSLNNLSLRSPVDQLKRTNFALFTVLNHKASGLGLNQHHWGRKKIALKNLLVLINQKPAEEFQFVKILTLNDLLSYIKYFPPIFTRKETESIANKLIGLSKS